MTELDLTTKIILGSMIFHADEFMDTNVSEDRLAFKTLLEDEGVKAFLSELSNSSLLPLRRDDKRYK